MELFLKRFLSWNVSAKNKLTALFLRQRGAVLLPAVHEERSGSEKSADRLMVQGVVFKSHA